MRPHSFLGCSGRFGQAGRHQPGLEGTSEQLRAPWEAEFLTSLPQQMTISVVLRASFSSSPRIPILTPCSRQVRRLFFNYLSKRPLQSLQTCLGGSGNHVPPAYTNDATLITIRVRRGGEACDFWGSEVREKIFQALREVGILPKVLELL